MVAKVNVPIAWIVIGLPITLLVATIVYFTLGWGWAIAAFMTTGWLTFGALAAWCYLVRDRD